MSAGKPEDPKLEAARRVADGGMPGTSGTNTDSRYHHNLQRLAHLTQAYAQSGTQKTSAADADFHWGHLRVAHLLGRGSFSRVYQAFDTVLQREVALKLREQPENAESPMEARAYIEEARRLARVRHPNVLAVHGADVHEGTVGIWTDLLSGETLEQRIQHRSELPLDQVLRIGRELSMALAAVHSADIVHGDLKAANVMLEPGPDGDKVVLMDFGAATANNDQTLLARYGTPLYMAPEQLRGSPPRASGDSYALGVLLYRMLCGEYPGTPENIDELIRVREQADFPALSTQRIPRALARLVRQLLHRQPDQRPNPEQTRQAIEDIITAPQRRRRRLAVAAVIGSLSIGILVATAFFLQARQAEQLARQSQVQAEATNQMLIGMMEQVAPRESPGGTIPTKYLLRAGRESLQEFDQLDPKISASLLLTLADLYNSFELEDDADQITQEAVQAAIGAYGEGSEPARRAMLGRALALTWLGERETAVELLNETLSLAQANNAGPAELAAIMNRRGWLATFLEQYDLARSDLYGALELVRQLQSPQHMLEIDILGNLSFLERFSGQYQAAKQHLDEAIAKLRDARMANERFVLARLLTLRANLARDADGDIETALTLKRRALEIFRELYDEPVKALATAEYEMGSALQNFDRLPEAVTYLERALEIYQRIGHSDATATAAMTLAKTQRKLGNLDEARRLLDITAENYRAAYGDQHFYIGMLLNERAQLELAAGAPGLAGDYARQSMAMFADTAGADHPVSGTASLTLGRALLAQQQWDGAEVNMRRSLDLWLEAFAEDDWRVADARYWLGMLYAARGEHALARQYLNQALPVLAAQSERFQPRIDEARRQLAQLPDGGSQAD